MKQPATRSFEIDAYSEDNASYTIKIYDRGKLYHHINMPTMKAAFRHLELLGYDWPTREQDTR